VLIISTFSGFALFLTYKNGNRITLFYICFSIFSATSILLPVRSPQVRVILFSYNFLLSARVLPVQIFWYQAVHFVGLIRTAELSSNLTYDPSALLVSFFVLTITALKTVPFLTLELGIASFTETTISSPRYAYVLLSHPELLCTGTFLRRSYLPPGNFVCI